MVIKGVLGAHGLLCPYQGLVGIGKTYPAKVGHGIGFYPNNVVQNPIAQVLQDAPDAVDIVIGADYPQGTGGLEDTPALCQPGFGEFIISVEILELVPRFVNAIHLGVVGAPEFCAELKVIRGVRKDQID